MSKSPAVLFYTSDFLTGTILFTDEETGQYIRLLCHQHQLGHLPKKHILKICGSKESPVLDKFQTDDKGLYFNKRMEEEINKRKEHAEKQRVRIQNYWNEKKKMEEPEPFHGNTTVLPLDNDNDNDNDIPVLQRTESVRLVNDSEEEEEEENSTQPIVEKAEKKRGRTPGKKRGRTPGKKSFFSNAKKSLTFVR